MPGLPLLAQTRFNAFLRFFLRTTSSIIAVFMGSVLLDTAVTRHTDPFSPQASPLEHEGRSHSNWSCCGTMTMNPKVLTADYMFGPSGWHEILLWPLLTSADPSESFTKFVVPEG